jgi:hypothetical protein
MNCNEIIEIYVKSLRSDLSSEESTLLNEHLKICSECRRALEWDSVIVSTLLKDKQTIPEENFTLEICRQISHTKFSFKHQLYDFITSSLEIIVPCFILTVLLIVFNTEIQNVLLLKMLNYYEKIIYIFQGYFGALLEFKMPEEISSIEPKIFPLLIWIGFAGLIYFVVSLSSLLSSLSDRRQ